MNQEAIQRKMKERLEMKQMLKLSSSPNLAPIPKNVPIVSKRTKRLSSKLLQPMKHPEHYKQQLQLDTIHESEEYTERINQSLRDFGTFGDIVEASRHELVFGSSKQSEARSNKPANGLLPMILNA